MDDKFLGFRIFLLLRLWVSVKKQEYWYGFVLPIDLYCFPTFVIRLLRRGRERQHSLKFGCKRGRDGAI